MKISLISSGKIKKDFFLAAEKDFQKRISRLCDFNIVRISAEKLNKNTNPQVAKEKEGENILKKINTDSLLISLDSQGKEFEARNFATFLKKKEALAKRIFFAIGGANGLSKEILKRSDEIISLSKMTFTQDLATICFLEMLFRGLCINNNLPFDR